MKLVKIVTIVIIMMTGLITYAKDNNKSIEKNELKKVLSKEITYPAFAKRNLQEGVVLVQFTINKGKIEIEIMNYSDIELGDYVRECLEKIILEKDDNNIGKTYAVKFEFKLL